MKAQYLVLPYKLRARNKVDAQQSQPCESDAEALRTGERMAKRFHGVGVMSQDYHEQADFAADPVVLATQAPPGQVGGVRGGGVMGTAYFVQAHEAKGTRPVGQASESYGYADEALAAARRLARWRAGIVVLKREVDDEGIPRGLPAARRQCWPRGSVRGCRRGP